MNTFFLEVYEVGSSDSDSNSFLSTREEVVDKPSALLLLSKMKLEPLYTELFKAHYRALLHECRHRPAEHQGPCSVVILEVV